MTSAIRLALIAFALVSPPRLRHLVYLYGPNKISAAELVPSDTVASPPSRTPPSSPPVYQTSHLKELVDSPNAKPLADAISQWLGQEKSRPAPRLRPQSQRPVVHRHHPHRSHRSLQDRASSPPQTQTGLRRFRRLRRQAEGRLSRCPRPRHFGRRTGRGPRLPMAPGPPGQQQVLRRPRPRLDRHRAWGEDALRDWWERYQKKASTRASSRTPTTKNRSTASEKTRKRFSISTATRFLRWRSSTGRQSIPPRPISPKNGSPSAPSRSHELRAGRHRRPFLGPDASHRFRFRHHSLRLRHAQVHRTRHPLLLGSNVNWNQVWKNLQEQPDAAPPGPPNGNLAAQLQDWAQSESLDIQHNIIDPLGGEATIQAEWGSDTSIRKSVSWSNSTSPTISSRP